MPVTFKEYECKSMLRTHKYVDNWFWNFASCSPYRACEHACNYCDGRSAKYHASEDFDNIIYVKINAIEVLKKELDRLFPKQRTLSDFQENAKVGPKKAKPVIAISSGISDAYQPAEKKYKLTRKILNLFMECEVPTYVMTKSDLVLRDLDILREINDKVWCNVSFSLSTVDERKAAIFEPRASHPKKRLDTMKKIHSEGILTGVTYMPVIPYITDSREHLENTVKTAKECGASYILAATMTMRDLQAARFYEILNTHYPELKEKYKALYWRGYEPHGKYVHELYKKVSSLCNKYDIKNYIPRYIPDIVLKKNLEISTALFQVAFFLNLKGQNHKARFYQKLAQTIEDMDENIEDIYHNGNLDEIKGIGNTTRKLVKEFIETGKCGYLEELTG